MNQKKKIIGFTIAVAAISLLTLSVRGSDLDGVGAIHFGGKVGFGSTSFSKDHHSMLGTPRSVFNIGGIVEYRVMPFLSAAVGVEYSQAGGSNLDPRLFYFRGSPIFGYTLAEGQSKNLIRTDLLVHAIEIPVTARVSIPETGGFKPFVMVGPAFDFRLKGMLSNYYEWNPGSLEVDGGSNAYDVPLPNLNVTRTYDDVTKKLAPITASALFGAGVDMEAFGFILELGLTYRIGLVNYNNYLYSTFQQYTSNTFSGYVAVKF